jgi:hypothetical protein
MGGWRVIRWSKEAVEWAVAIWHILGWLGFASIISGLAISVGGGVWAVIIGVPLPIAIMAGYCTFIGAVFLTMSPMAFRSLTNIRQAAPKTKIEPLTYEAWRHVDQFTISAAARLWSDIDPNEADTVKTAAWQNAFIAAIKKGEMGIVPKGFGHAAEEYECNHADWATNVTREELKKFAKKYGYAPRFLDD